MATKTPVAVELFYDGAWHDITATDDVYSRDPITVSRPEPQTVGHVPPAVMSATVRNVSGDYSPRNPASPLYGLIGRNTPLRAIVSGFDVTADTFNRENSVGWGVCEFDATPWIFSGSGGSVVETDSTITPLTAAHNVPTTSAFRFNYTNSDLPADITVTVRLKVVVGGSGVNILTSDIEGGLMMRVQSISSYYHPRVEFHADQSIGLSLHVVGGTGSIGSVTPIGSIVFDGQWLMLKAQCVGSTIRAKVWEDGSPEPAAWDLSVTNTEITAAGGVGLRSGVAAGNTNSDRNLLYQNLTLDHAPRFTGEIESWPLRWNVKGSDAWAPITAHGISRRLLAASERRAKHSALYRYIMARSPHAYWTLEDGTDSTTGTPATAATGLMLPTFTATGATASWGTGELAAWYPLGFGTTGTVGLRGNPPGGPAPSELAIDVLRRGHGVTSSSAFVSFGLFQASASGTSIWEYYALMSWNAGSPTLELWREVTGSAPTLIDTAAVTDADAAWDDELHVWRMYMEQSGADVDVSVSLDGILVMAGTHANATTRIPKFNITNFETDRGAWSNAVMWVGAANIPNEAEYNEVVFGYNGERAADRISRICAEEGIAVTILGDPAKSEMMGPQPTGAHMDVIHDASETDGGMLYDPRTFLGLAYRTHYSRYNQAPAVTLDYAAGGEVLPPLEPEDDTSGLVNDVTVIRRDGGRARAVQLAGPNNVSEPTTDPQGVGRYEAEYTLGLHDDGQAAEHAAWLRHVGTWDELRFSNIAMSLNAMVVDGKTTLAGQAASLNTGDVLVVTNPPVWAQQASPTIEQYAHGLTDELASHRWVISVNTKPAGPYTVALLEDGTLGRADTSGSELDADFDAGTDTSMDVAVTAGPLWITTADHAAMFPFDIKAAGVILTVTASSGASSPQTFTITATPVNGIVKTIPAGTPVSLAYPARAAR